MRESSSGAASWRRFLVSAFAVTALSSCAIQPRLEATQADLLRPHLTEEAYRRAAAPLDALEPRQLLTPESVGWSYFSLSSRAEGEHWIAVADAWIPGMSGGFVGAVELLGFLVARDATTLYGEHLFGYIWGEINLVPRSRLLTAATIIEESEYQRIEGEPGRVGSIDLAGSGRRTFFRDVRVHRVEPLSFQPPDLSQVDRVVELSRDEFLRSLREHYAEDRYSRIEPLLDALEPGIDYWEVDRRLGARFVTFDQGADYFTEMDGFLNYRENLPWTKTTDAAKYQVWTFGFLEAEHEVPRRFAVFENGKLLAVVPFATREEIEERFFRRVSEVP